MSRAPSARLGWIRAAVWIAGALGLLVSEWRRLETDAGATARGAFWKALDEEGAPLRVRREAMFRLEDGELVELDVAAIGAPRRVALRGQLQKAGAFFDVVVVTGGPTYALRIAPEESFGVQLGRHSDTGKFQPVAARQRGVVAFEPFEADLSFDGGELVARVDGRECGRVAVGERRRGRGDHARPRRPHGGERPRRARRRG